MNQVRRKKPQEQKNRSSKVWNATLIIIVSGLIYAFLSKKMGLPMHQDLSALTARTTGADKTPGSKSAELDQPRNENTDALNDRRLAFLGKDSVGISTLPIFESDGEITVPIIFRPKTIWCQGGDLDTIRYSMADPRSADLTVSVESLNGDLRVSSFNVSTVDLMKGFTHNFRIRTKRNGESFGLFICKNTGKSKSCQSKKTRTHGEISRLLSDEKTSDQAKREDYIFYFQSLIFGKDGLSVFKANDFLEKDISALKNQLSAQLSVNDSDFKKTWSFASKIKSLPAKIVGEAITVSMLYNDPRCNKSTTP